MNIKKMLEKQMALDSRIKNIRKRTKLDIRLSLIAELIEFNEELECSHKTWKDKTIDNKKQLEEYVDCWFFALQELKELYKPFATIKEYLKHEEIEAIFLRGKSSKLEIQKSVIEAIHIFSNTENSCVVDIFSCLSVLGGIMGYKTEQIEQEYNRKWEINMNRIGREWR